MFILAAEFHIYTHRIHQRNRYRSCLDLKPNRVSVCLVVFFSLPLSLSPYPCTLDLFLHTPCFYHHPWISDLLPKGSWRSIRTQSLKQTGPPPTVTALSLFSPGTRCCSTHRLKYSLLFSEWKHMIVLRSTQFSFDFFYSIFLLLKEKIGTFGAWSLQSPLPSPVNSLGHLYGAIQPLY